MLSARELNDLRSIAQRALPDTATIQRRALVSDGQLGQTETWVTVASEVPCRVDEQNDGRGDVTIGGRASSTGDIFLRLPYGVPIQETDQIRVDTSSRGRLFEVARVIETSYATVLTVLVTEVR